MHYEFPNLCPLPPPLPQLPVPIFLPLTLVSPSPSCVRAALVNDPCCPLPPPPLLPNNPPSPILFMKARGPSPAMLHLVTRNSMPPKNSPRKPKSMKAKRSPMDTMGCTVYGPAFQLGRPASSSLWLNMWKMDTPPWPPPWFWAFCCWLSSSSWRIEPWNNHMLRIIIGAEYKNPSALLVKQPHCLSSDLGSITL